MIGSDHEWLRRKLGEFGHAVTGKPSQFFYNKYAQRVGISPSIDELHRLEAMFLSIMDNEIRGAFHPRDEKIYGIVMLLSEPRMHMGRWRDMGRLFHELGVLMTAVDAVAFGTDLAFLKHTGPLLTHASHALHHGAPWLFAGDMTDVIDRALKEDDTGYTKTWYELAQRLVGEREIS